MTTVILLFVCCLFVLAALILIAPPFFDKIYRTFTMFLSAKDDHLSSALC